jgi:2-isopropylmalate synthase
MTATDEHARVWIFDTTLRDGEQGAGASMRPEDKVAIAKKLDAMGVDIIEAGYPAASAGAFAVVETVATVCTRARICALARGTKEDIDAAVKALLPAGERARIHIFVATDPLHMREKLRQTEEQVLARIYEYVAYAKQFVEDIEFSPEVATTSETSFLYRAIDAAVAAGATVINVPDTTGAVLPHEYAAVIQGVINHLKYAPHVIVSVHCHNDFGVATANSLEGLRAGARQVECTVNGIGERAGNTALEEVLMALTLRPNVFKLTHAVVTRDLCKLSALVATVSSTSVSPNKAFVGRNAFAHESGIHQDGVLKNASLYEVCDPALVGAHRRLPLGKLSGRAGVAATLERLGFLPTALDVQHIYEAVMVYADQFQTVPDDVVQSMAAERGISLLK